jgi:hypothetical protein
MRGLSLAAVLARRTLSKKLRSRVLAVIVLGVAAAYVAASSLTFGARLHGDGQRPAFHEQIVTRVTVAHAFGVGDLRVTAQSAQWVRQPRPIEPIGTSRGEPSAGANADRLYLNVVLENHGVSPHNVGRGAFRVRAPMGRTGRRWRTTFPISRWAPAKRLPQG